MRGFNSLSYRPEERDQSYEHVKISRDKLVRTYVKTLFNVKSVNAVIGPTQVVVLMFTTELAQNPLASTVSFGRKYPQHLN